MPLHVTQRGINKGTIFPEAEDCCHFRHLLHRAFRDRGIALPSAWATKAGPRDGRGLLTTHPLFKPRCRATGCGHDRRGGAECAHRFPASVRAPGSGAAMAGARPARRTRRTTPRHVHRCAHRRRLPTAWDRMQRSARHGMARLCVASKRQHRTLQDCSRVRAGLTSSIHTPAKRNRFASEFVHRDTPRAMALVAKSNT